MCGFFFSWEFKCLSNHELYLSAAKLLKDSQSFPVDNLAQLVEFMPYFCDKFKSTIFDVIHSLQTWLFLFDTTINALEHLLKWSERAIKIYHMECEISFQLLEIIGAFSQSSKFHPKIRVVQA